jgi:tripartite-type tricarboxylate transporter receptor subunit TctC
MNEEVKRLLKNIKTLIEANALEAELEACALDNMYSVETIEEFNDYIEESMTYWE